MPFCCNSLYACRELSATQYGMGPAFQQLAEESTAPSLGSLQLLNKASLMPTACVQCFVCQVIIFGTVSRSAILLILCYRIPAEGKLSVTSVLHKLFYDITNFVKWNALLLISPIQCKLHRDPVNQNTAGIRACCSVQHQDTLNKCCILHGGMRFLSLQVKHCLPKLG